MQTKEILLRIFRVLLPIAILGMGIAAYSILSISESEDVVELPEPRARLVQVQEIKKQTLSPSVELFGRVTTSATSKLSSALDAEVLEVNVLPGQIVNTGEVLIRLDSRDIETQIIQNEASVNQILATIKREEERLESDQEILVHEKRLLELAVAANARTEVLEKRNVISQTEADNAARIEQQAALAVTARNASIRNHPTRVLELEANLMRAQAALEKSLKDLEEATITAPYKGRIVTVYVALGSQSSRNAPLVEMYDHTSTEVRTLIPSRHLEGLRSAFIKGRELTASTSLNGEKLMLRFNRLSSIVDPGRGGVDGYFGIDSDAYFPELGRTLVVNLSLQPVKNAMLIPYSAVYGSTTVFKVESDVLKSAEIQRYGQVIQNDEQFVVATSDQLNSNDLLVTTQINDAVNGLKVSIWLPE